MSPAAGRWVEVARRRGPWAAALLVCAVHFASFDPRNAPLATDVRYYVYFAWRITEGDVPHVDYFDNKTQLASFAGALFHALADAAGADPLLAMRAGYLALAALGGALAFLAFRRLDGGSGLGGLLGALAWCAFGLTGLMSAMGPVPKLLMGVAATAACLLAHERRWFAAGLVAALAFLDWQIGALVGVAVFAAALAFGRPRARAAIAVAAGFAAGLAPFAAWLAARGALEATFEQVVVASLFRGTQALESSTLALRLRMIWLSASSACGPQRWLLAAAVPGLFVVAAWLWRWRASDRMRLLLPLAIYHYGLVAFSLVDFQWHGDLLILVQSAAFFLAALWIASARWALGRLAPAPGPRRLALAALALALAVAAARPGPLRPPLELARTQPPVAGVTLADQREVADALRARIGEARIAFVEHSELLYLMQRRNGLPVIFWNRPAWSQYRLSPDEPYREAALRLIRSADPDVVVVPEEQRHFLPDPETGRPGRIRIDFRPSLHGYAPIEVASRNDRYRVSAWIRDGGAAPAGTPPPAGVDPEELSRLRALGYAEHGEPLPPGSSVGVVRHDEARAAPGLNYFTETRACASHLMDMQGRILHSWSIAPCFRWDNSVLLPDGDVLATSRLFRGRDPASADAARALLRLAWDGSVRWKKALPVHHDVEMTPDGRILVLTHRLRAIPELHTSVPVRDNLILLLSPEGETLGELSLWDSFRAAPGVLPLEHQDPIRFEGSLEIDLFHANAIEWMRQPQPGSAHPVHREDTILLSMRHQDAIAVVDWPGRRPLWAWGRGEVIGPHDATLLANGHVLLFDNGLGRGWSRVVELDPATGRIVWEYRAADPPSFYSKSRGAAQRLRNGNTLVTESDRGRAFEVTPDGEVVWDFVDPHLTARREPEIIFRMRRLEGLDREGLERRVRDGAGFPRVD
jgi:hypothetical protein